MNVVGDFLKRQLDRPMSFVFILLMLQAKPPPGVVKSSQRPLFTVSSYKQVLAEASVLTHLTVQAGGIYSNQDDKMLSIILIPAVFQFALTVHASATKKCNSVKSNTCFQQCNSTSCKCASSYGDYVYTACSQTCGSNKCKEITCSSGTCYQKCHDCQMECTSDVDYCNQQCLSGACSFKCSAKRCVQECDGKTCKHLPSDHEEPFIPRLYLVILAGLFAATTILTCLALAFSCSQMGFRRRRRRPAPLATRNLGSSIRSFPTKSTIV